MTELDKIKAKIRALLGKTTSAGCTEAEAMSAAEVAARLMASHGLSVADIEITATRVKGATKTATWRSFLGATIAGACNCHMLTIVGRTAEIEFTGRAHEVEVAAYLYAVLVRAVDREAKLFAATPEVGGMYPSRAKRAISDFRLVMAARLAQRVKGLFADQADEKARNAAETAVTTAAGRNLQTQQKRGMRSTVMAGAADAAEQAAAGVTIARGMNNSAPVRALAGR